METIVIFTEKKAFQVICIPQKYDGISNVSNA